MRRKPVDAGNRNLVGPKLKEARKLKKLSQEKVVEILEFEFGMKMDRTALTRLENQQRAIDDFEFIALAKIYEVEIGWLFEQKRSV